ncbi:DUF4397 domain-containing protein [Vibrio profundi]|uniref:DUF4397 domain-containing protein n=1 Tax=Vibrio profundi TaxID=1774960 RepID=UPI003736F967
MKAITLSAVLGLSLGFLSGCDSDDEKTNLQAVHASADAPLTNVFINGENRFTGVDYAQASGFIEVDDGRNTVKVDVQLPAGQSLTVIDTTKLNLSAEMDYTVMVVGDADGSTNPVEALVVTRPAEGNASATMLDVQLVHAASGVGDVNIYVTEPGADLASSTPVGPVSYKGFSGVLTIPSGQYQIRIQTAADDAIAFDSGTVSLSPNTELTVAAVKRTETSGASPVQLMVMDGAGSSTIYDKDEQAELRVGHLVDGAPNVDVYVNDVQFAPLDSLAFKQIRGFLDLDADDYDLSVYVEGTSSPALIDADGVSLNAGKDYSVYAVGTSTPVALEPLVVEENRRSVATSAVLNVTHGAANDLAALVDIYLTTSTGIDGSDPTVSDFAYKESINGLYVEEGSYYVTITVANQPDVVAIDSAPVSVESGSVYQVVAIDDGNNGGFNLLVSETTD